MRIGRMTERTTLAEHWVLLVDLSAWLFGGVIGWKSDVVAGWLRCVAVLSSCQTHCM